MDLVRRLVGILEKMEMMSFYQDGFSQTGPHWKTQWYKAAKEAAAIVCILTALYTESEPCCEVHAGRGCVHAIKLANNDLS